MANNDTEEKIGLQSAIGIGPGRGSERLRKNPDAGTDDQSEQMTRSAGDTGRGDKEDADVNTAGGREGDFEESKRGEEDQWSPGSTQSSDQ